MKFITFATNCLLGIATALPQGSIEKDAEWTVTNLTVHSQLSGLKLATSYSFNLKTSTQTAQCEAMSDLGSAPLGTRSKISCIPKNFSFAWTPSFTDEDDFDGATLELFDATTKQHAYHPVSADQIGLQLWVVRNSHPHVYKGPTEFVVETHLG